MATKVTGVILRNSKNEVRKSVVEKLGIHQWDIRSLIPPLYTKNHLLQAYQLVLQQLASKSL